MDREILRDSIKESNEGSVRFIKKEISVSNSTQYKEIKYKYSVTSVGSHNRPIVIYYFPKP